MKSEHTSHITPELIEKENVPQYTFVTYDVLNTPEERALRAIDLEKAMVLGNAEHVKISILFMTTDGMKKVETTVWATTQDAIMLKGGISIPVHCISDIRLI